MKRNFILGLAITLLLSIGWLMPGCLPQKNRPPSVAEVSCPSATKVGDSIAISVVAYDRDRDKIAYKIAFGDSVQSEWSDYLPSGEPKVFYYTYNRAGTFGVYAIASDHHRLNSGWSEKTFIEVAPVVVRFEEIGTTTDRFFWALKEFEGKLYAGTYGTPKAYNYPPWTFLKNLGAGESITDFEAFKGKLYASTEKKGYIYRMDSPTDWKIVHTDSYIYALNLVIFGDYLYCLYAKVGGGEKIIRSLDGTNWSTVWTSSDWCRHFVLYEEELYLVGSAGGYSRAVKTSNGTNWVDVPELANVFRGEWFSPVAWDGKLWLSTGGNTCRARIYKFDGTDLIEVFRNEGVYEVYMLHVYSNEIYALLQPDWKQPGDSFLYKSSTGESGTWNLIKSFPGKSWARCAETFQNELYLGIQNTVYKIIRE